MVIKTKKMGFRILYKNPRVANVQDGKSYKRGVTQFESYDNKTYASKASAERALQAYKKKYKNGATGERYSKYKISKTKEAKQRNNVIQGLYGEVRY